MWEPASAAVEPAADFRAPSRQAAIHPLTSRAMTAENAKIHAIYRYPVKGLSPEPLARTTLAVQDTLPADRLYAIENGPSGFDPTAPRHQPKQRYLMLMRNERLARLRTRFNDSSHTLTVEEQGREAARRSNGSSRSSAPTSCEARRKCCTHPASASPTLRARWSRSSTSPRSPRSKTPSAGPSIRCAFVAMST